MADPTGETLLAIDLGQNHRGTAMLQPARRPTWAVPEPVLSLLETVSPTCPLVQ
jgi:hypothetical protein